jgi:hypothetical protein
LVLDRDIQPPCGLIEREAVEAVEVHAGGRSAAAVGIIGSAAGDRVDDAGGGVDAADEHRVAQVEHKHIARAVDRQVVGKGERRLGGRSAVAAALVERLMEHGVLDTGDAADDPRRAVHVAKSVVIRDDYIVARANGHAKR